MTKAVTTSATYAPAPESVGAARRFVGGVLRTRGCSDDAIEDATLLTSEIVTNAVVHARTELKLHLSVSSGTIRVEVDDQGMGATVLTYAEPDEVRGRGLSIVEALADRWGEEHRAGGRHRVWFELAVNA